MAYAKKAKLLIASANNARLYSNDTDEGAALQKAIDTVFPNTADYGRADLYARLMEGWDKYSYGVPKRVFVTKTLREWAAWYSTSTNPEGDTDADA